MATAMAPMEVAASKARIHSGKLRIEIATRSPLATPKRWTSRWAMRPAWRCASAKVSRSSS